MRAFANALGAFVAALIAVAPACATNFTATQLNNAKLGLQAMRELNVVVLGNLNSGQEIEGKTFVGGNVSGGNENFGIGDSTSGNKETASTRAILTVGGYVSSNITINNGSNGDSGNVIGSTAENVVKVGGNLTGTVTMNSAISNLAGTVKTGGSFNDQNFNPNANKTVQYGTTASNVQAQDQAYVTQNTSLAAGGSASLATSILSDANALKTQLTTLSDVLASLTPNATLNLSDRNAIQFDYTTASNNADYVVVNVAASDLFSSGGTMNLSLLNSATSGTGYKTVIVNVTGLTSGASYNYTLNNNDTQNSNDSNIIWNFDASATNISLSLGSSFHGSILAPNLTVSNSTAVEGTVVANMFNQGGEVHLGTFQSVTSIVPTAAVPEVSTWVLMMIGFGAIGRIIRKQKRLGIPLRI